MMEGKARITDWRQAEVGGLTRQHLISDGNTLLFGEGQLAEGEENVRHLHDYGDEIIYILQGEVECQTDAKTVLLKSGESYSIPKGIPHKLLNKRGADARYLFIIHPLAPTPSQGHRIL